MIKQEYLEKLLEARQNVLKATEGLSDEEMSRPMGEGKWSIKDTLGHLAAWEAEAVKAFEQKARGERPTIGDIKDFDAWNKVGSEKRKGHSVEQIRQELNETRRRLLTILDGLPPDGDVWSAERTTAKLINMLIEHDTHHWKKIYEDRCGGAS